MSGQRFAKGDAVATLHRIGNGVEKRRLGEVVEVGAKGARVRFHDGETLWLPAGRLWHVTERGEGQELTKSRPEEPRKLRAVGPADAPAAAEPPPVDHDFDVVEAIQAGGADPYAAWLALGRQLVERERSAVAQAEESERAAAASVASAEELLAQERAALARAQGATRAARERLDMIKARVGGGEA